MGARLWSSREVVFLSRKFEDQLWCDEKSEFPSQNNRRKTCYAAVLVYLLPAAQIQLCRSGNERSGFPVKYCVTRSILSSHLRICPICHSRQRDLLLWMQLNQIELHWTYYSMFNTDGYVTLTLSVLFVTDGRIIFRNYSTLSIRGRSKQYYFGVYLLIQVGTLLFGAILHDQT